MSDPRAIYFPCVHKGKLGNYVSMCIDVDGVWLDNTIHALAVGIPGIMLVNGQYQFVSIPERVELVVARLYAKYGITALVDLVGGDHYTARLHFTALPEITYMYEFDSKTIGFMHLSDIYQKLIKKYLTPYVEEAYTLELLPRVLPQPIAEAITDCIMGVISRRIALYGNRVEPIWQNAWSQETCLTYVDMFGYWPPINEKIPAGESWEAAAAEITLNEGW